MYCPNDKMKINKFKLVAIPRNVAYIKRFGRVVAPANQFTGEQYAPMSMNKVDSFAALERYDAMMQEKERAAEAAKNDGRE